MKSISVAKQPQERQKKMRGRERQQQRLEVLVAQEAEYEELVLARVSVGAPQDMV